MEPYPYRASLFFLLLLLHVLPRHALLLVLCAHTKAAKKPLAPMGGIYAGGGMSFAQISACEGGEERKGKGRDGSAYLWE